MSELEIVALGPDDARLMTQAARDALRGSRNLLLRTERHGAVTWLKSEGIPYRSLDGIYEETEDFDELCRLTVRMVLRELESGDVCYAVSDPAGDETVRQLLGSLPHGTQTRILPGVTGAQVLLNAALPAGVKTEEYRVFAANALDAYRPSADVPLLITELDNRLLASDVKLWLTDLFRDEMEVFFLQNAAVLDPEVKRIPLCELDQQPEYDHRTALLVPTAGYMDRERADYEDLVQVVAKLRSPEGCPWDREQTHDSLQKYMIEEACEAAEALQSGEPGEIADELGDVLLQVVLNSQIGAEHHAFTDRDVTTAIVRKMISRHPHVFGQVHAERPDEVVLLWDRLKQEERGQQSGCERMEEVAVTLPALMRAQKVQKREARAYGNPILEEEAIREIRRLLENTEDHEEIVGRLLEEVCNLAECWKLDAETCLRKATGKRIERRK